MNGKESVGRKGPADGFRFFSLFLVLLGLLALFFVVMRVFESNYPSPTEVQFRWSVFGAAISTIWFGWLGLVVSAILERVDKKPVE